MASLIRNIIGHEKQLTQLQQMVAQGRLPASFIFNGPSGIGKKQIVRALLQILLCQRDVEACGECSHCTRVLDEQNEFIYELGLQEKKKISVDQVRDLHPFLNLASVTSARFVIVDPADQMSIQAANALLKVLEEPPKNTHFFLITERFSSLLPTIRSRCQILNFHTLSHEEMGQIPELEPQYVEWAGGRPSFALQLATEKKTDIVGDAFKTMNLMVRGEPQDWKKIIPSFFKTDSDRETIFRLWQLGLQRKLRGEQSSFLQELPDHPQMLVAMSEVLQKSVGHLYGNVDKLLVLENIFYSWQLSLNNPEEALWNSPANL